MIRCLISYLTDRLRGELNIHKLKKNGLLLGDNFSFGRGCFIDPSHCFLIEIGNNVVFSSKVHVLAHDASTKKYLGYTKIGCTKIEDNCFIGANTIILPGVKIEKNSIVGAGSVVTKSIPSNSVFAGNPAKFICTVDDYLKKFDNIDKSLFFDESYTFRNKMTVEQKNEMKEKIKDGIGFVE